jgi:hypothetical protein
MIGWLLALILAVMLVWNVQNHDHKVHIRMNYEMRRDPVYEERLMP